MTSKLLLLAVLVATTCSFVVLACDPSPLQDFCVANLKSPVIVNGFVCKNPRQVEANDFFSMALRSPASTSNSQGSGFIPVVVNNLAGLNTLGISMARSDFAPQGVFPLHTHPRATEIITVAQGSILVGFITSTDFQLPNRVFSKVLTPGDVFVFPVGLVHFQQNVGRGPAVAYSAFNSQSPGLIIVGNATFGANPDIPLDVLAKSFLTTEPIIKQIQTNF